MLPPKFSVKPVSHLSCNSAGHYGSYYDHCQRCFGINEQLLTSPWLFPNILADSGVNGRQCGCRPSFFLGVGNVLYALFCPRREPNVDFMLHPQCLAAACIGTAPFPKGPALMGGGHRATANCPVDPGGRRLDWDICFAGLHTTLA